jgi:MFS family permease
MSTQAPARRSKDAVARPLRPASYAWALALVTALDYFDSSLFSYFASFIAGGISASPDELVWSSSSYAVGAVLGILQQQWWVERLGNRRYIAACMMLYAAAAGLSALSQTSFQLMLTRAAQGYLVGPMMGTCRILLQDGGFLPEHLASGRRLFLKAIVMANSLAPIVGGVLLSHFEWQALFVCTIPAGVLLAGFVLYAVPDIGKAEARAETGDDSESHFWPYLAFALSQGALQIVLQQLHFQLFSSSAVLGGLLLMSLAGMGYFAHHQWHHPRPLVQLQGLRERTFLVGLTLYGFYYFLTTGFGYLTLRFLEQGLSYPVENAGWFVGVTSLFSVLMLSAYFRYSSRVVHKKWLIVPGFAIAAAAAWIMTRMPPDASQPALVVPLVLRGALVMFVAVPVANLTFRLFSIDEFAHTYRLKNIVRQLVVSFATSSVIVIEQHREALHYARLIESINPFNPALSQTMDKLADVATMAGRATSEGHAIAFAQIDRMVLQQANFLAILDGFYFLIAVAICGGLIAALQRRIN